MFKNAKYGLVLALLLVGAGCGAKQDIELDADAGGASGTRLEDGAKVDVKGEGSVDAAVDSILEGTSEEQRQQDEETKNADEFGDDAAELNAFSEGEYELK